MALVAALFAVMLNFLQPLAHAALMRDGTPSTLWNMFCSATSQDARKDSTPVTADKHECCLGLAHVAAIATRSARVDMVERVVSAVQSLQPADSLTPVGIRDGPHRPRGPPAFV